MRKNIIKMSGVALMTAMLLLASSCKMGNTKVSLKSPLGSGDKEDSEIVLSDDPVSCDKNMEKARKLINLALEQGKFHQAYFTLSELSSYMSPENNGSKGLKCAYDKEGNIGKGLYDFTSKDFTALAHSILEKDAEFLMEKGSPEAEQLFMEHLNEYGMYNYDVDINSDDLYGNYGKNGSYQSEVKGYNDLCLKLINKSLIRHNAELAKELHLMMKEDLLFEHANTGNTSGKWYYSKESINKGQELIDKYVATH